MFLAKMEVTYVLFWQPSVKRELQIQSRAYNIAFKPLTNVVTHWIQQMCGAHALSWALI